MKRTNYFYLLLISFLLITASCDNEKHELKFNPIVGKKYLLKQDTEQNIRQTLNNTEQNVQNKTTMILSFLVKNKFDQKIEIDVTIDRVIYSMKSEGMNMSFDTDKRPVPVDNMIAKIFYELIGKTLTITINSTGEILSVMGSDLIFETIINGLNVPNQAAREQLKGSLNNVIGEKAFKGNLGMITYIFPEKPVAVGGKWENETMLEQMVPTEIENEWTLQSINEEVAIIKGNSSIIADNVKPLANIGKMETTYNLRGTQDAIIEVDAFTGWILSAEMNNVISGTIEVGPNANAPNGTSIPLEFSTHTKYTTID